MLFYFVPILKFVNGESKRKVRKKLLTKRKKNSRIQIGNKTVRKEKKNV